MTTTAKLPTPAGRRVLLNIAAGRGSSWGVYGMSAHGGLCATIAALRRAGLLTPLTEGEHLTAAGRAMVERLMRAVGPGSE